MTGIDERALNEKLLVYAGFKPLTNAERWPEISTNRPDDIVGWRYPTGEVSTLPPDLTRSLDKVFYYLVPKLPALSLISYGRGKGFGACINSPHYEADADIAALALCLAIEKLIPPSG